MKNFEHVDASSSDSVVRLLDPEGLSRVIAGGTDLLTEMKSRIATPNRLINLKTIPGMSEVQFDEETGLLAGALATLSDLARNETVKNRYPLLLKAISLAATVQIRNRGTIGGNLLQDSRCWYYRGPFECWLKGGKVCYARDGENQHHAIFSDGPCYTVHPSDLAVALIALETEVKLVGLNGERNIPLEQLFQSPREGDRRLVTLHRDEIVSSISIPPPEVNHRGIYLKAMDRKAWAFAMVSVAAWLSFDSEVVKNARIVLGGVALHPYLIPAIEGELKGKSLDEKTISRVADIAMDGAKPLSHNHYKVSLAREMVKQALVSLSH